MFNFDDTSQKTVKNPTKLLIVSQPKVGKTELLTKLKDNHIVDWNNSTQFYQEGALATIFNVVQKYKEYIAKGGSDLYELYAFKYLKYLRDKALKDGPFTKFLTLDTLTDLEGLARMIALQKYKATPIGKNFKGNDITTLPNGLGYSYLRSAFIELYEMLEPCYTDCIILLAHPKSSKIRQGDQEVLTSELNLIGSLKQIITSDMDAMGSLYRDKDGMTNILSFKTKEGDLISGSRSPHLANQNIIISKMTDTGLECSWDQVFVK
jgi:hypothetical protein